MREKMTKAQMEWLRHVASYDAASGAPVRTRALPGYVAPLRRLLRRGLVLRTPHPNQKYRGNFALLQITPAGRAALQKDTTHG